jgi:hypothetical protein
MNIPKANATHPLTRVEVKHSLALTMAITLSRSARERKALSLLHFSQKTTETIQ